LGSCMAQWAETITPTQHYRITYVNYFQSCWRNGLSIGCPLYPVTTPQKM